MTKLIREETGTIGAGTSGKYRIRIMDAGVGSSGLYQKPVLERDGKAAFPAGTKIFVNHPTESEEWEQPARDVNKIVGKTLTDAVYEDGALYCDIKVIDSFVPIIEEFKDILGMSIYAYVESEFETVGDYTGTVITSLIPAGNPNMHSIDVVTAAGRNGAILERITESFKRQAQESGNKPTATSAEEHEEQEHEEREGATVTKEILEAIAAVESKLNAKIDTILATKTQEAQAEVDADAIAEAKKEAVEQFDAQADLIAKADLLPAQESALKSALKRGEDITDRLEEAKTVAKEAAELGASRGDRVAETGRFVAGKVTESAEPEKPVNLKGLFS